MRVVNILILIFSIFLFLPQSKAGDQMPYNLLKNIRSFNLTKYDDVHVKKSRVKNESKLVFQKPAEKKVESNIDILVLQDADTSKIFIDGSNGMFASYQRDGFLWIIISADKTPYIKISDNLPQNVLISHPIIKSYEIEKISNGAVLIKFAIDNSDQGDFSFSKTLKSENRIILEMTKEKAVENDIDIYTRPFDVKGAKVEFGIMNPNNTQVITINQHGSFEPLTFILMKDLQRVAQNYKFVNFDLLETNHGIVLRHKSDGLTFEKKDNLFSVTKVGGLDVSSVKNTKLRIFDKSCFKKLEEFGVTPGVLTIKSYKKKLPKFSNDEKIINKKLDDASTLSQEVDLRMNLALLYLANSFFQEAIVQLEYIAYKDQDIYANYAFLLAYTAAEMLRKDFGKAKSIFQKIDLAAIPSGDIEEVNFWNNALNLDNENSLLSVYNEMSNMKNNFLNDYPQNIILAIKFNILNKYMELKNYDKAEKVIDSIDVNTLNKARLSEYFLQKSLIEYARNNQSASMDLLTKCIDSSGSFYYQSICKEKLTMEKLRAGSINLEEAIMDLRIIDLDFRNTPLELDVLSKIVDLYKKSGKYLQAIEVLKDISESYIDTPEGLNSNKEMAEVFLGIFLGDLASKYNIFQKVALFYDVYPLIYLGEDRKKVLSRVVLYLKDLDLPEDASDILNDEIRSTDNPMDKERLFNELLATLYEAKKYDDIIGFMNIMSLSKISKKDKDFRNRIYAKALRGQKEYEKALVLLHDDKSGEANHIRAQIYWEINDWSNFENNIEPAIYNILDGKRGVTQAEAELMLKISISYANTEKKHLLKKLIVESSFQMKEKYPKIFSSMKLLLNLSDNAKSLQKIDIKHLEEQLNSFQ